MNEKRQPSHILKIEFPLYLLHGGETEQEVAVVSASIKAMQAATESFEAHICGDPTVSLEETPNHPKGEAH
jgi:hypothetical protein